MVFLPFFIINSSNNTCIGAYAGAQLRASKVYERNVLIGYNAGRYLNSKNNICIGYKSGFSFINTNSGYIIIDNDNSWPFIRFRSQGGKIVLFMEDNIQIAHQQTILYL